MNAAAGDAATGVAVAAMQADGRPVYCFGGDGLPAGRRSRDEAMLGLLHRLALPPPSAGPDLHLAIVAASTEAGCTADVECGRLLPDRRTIDWDEPACGPVAAAACFGLAAGLVQSCADPAVAAPPPRLQRLRAWLPATQRRLELRLPAAPLAGSPVEVDFDLLEPSTHALPTGSACDALQAGPQSVAVTWIDAGRLVLLLRADRHGLAACLGGTGASARSAAIARLRVIGEAAMRCRERVPALSVAGRGGASGELELVLLGPSAGGDAPAPGTSEGAVDLTARLWHGGRLHDRLSDAAATALAVAAAIPGSPVATAARTLPGLPTRIGTGAARIAVAADVVYGRGRWRVLKSTSSCVVTCVLSGRAYF